MERVDIGVFFTSPADRAVSSRVASILEKAVYVSLVCLVVFTSIPYGTNALWLKAIFICAVFVLFILAIVEGLARGSWKTHGTALLLPLATLAAFSILQSIPFGHTVLGTSRTISADPYATKFVTLQLVALTLAAALLYRYAIGERRVRILIHIVIAVAVASAIFGMLRQTTQREAGFVLPLLLPDQGYGQFINRNHFAFLMEMGLGLALGMIIGGGVKREKTLIYFASLLPIWTALVLSNSRGGLLAMLVQIVVAGLLLTLVVSESSSHIAGLRFLRVARSLKVRILLLLVLLAGVVVGTAWVGGDRLAARIEDARSQADSQGVSRNEIWRATWKMFKAHPIVGVGMGGYWIGIHQHHDASGVLAPQEAHNDYLEVLASGGVIGAGLLIWFMVVLFRRTQTNLRSSNQFQRAACFGATLGIVGVGFHSLFDFGLHLLANAFIFIVLVVIATSTRVPEKKYTASDA